MTFPTIHRNGTYASDLLKGLLAAMNALREAERKITDAAPNGRDYYPQGDAAINHAIEEHCDRLTRLEAIRHELDQIAEHVAKEMHEQS